ncbi:hypothetical protein ANCCAN_09049 [Ancylostoma caninum]|uniref:Receptor ligand binding region domain-containing protein n=1 Tax=Ancylostoma caninum TaxID=29170 RepID=A0A368GPK6_ANCCA|nr:hypothetical protein ANCCAN_09049 [Ancylostoma caninum]
MPYVSHCLAQHIALLLWVTILLVQLSLQYPSKVIIKSFTTSSEEANVAVQALQFAADEINTGPEAPFRLAYDHYDIETGSSEGWSVVNKVCQELKEGGMTVISIDGGRGNEAVRGLADTLEMPLISLTSPLYPQDPPNFFEVSVRPSSAELLADFIIHKRWREIIMLTDGEFSGVPLPWLWHHLHRKSNRSTSAQLLELPRDPEKFSEFLRQFNLERSNFTNRILIDTTSAARQQKFLAAIRTAQFSQANYHYVVANFDFLPYDVEMFQNGNINISGFQLINKEGRAYWNLKKHLKKLDDTFINTYGDVDSRAALAHDAMLVAWSGFAKCLATNDSLFHGTFRHGRFFNRGYPGIYCDPLADRVHPARPFASFEHGRTVAKALRGLRIDAKDGTLTGDIEFDRFGHRKNYDVAVVDLVSNTKATFNSKEVRSKWITLRVHFGQDVGFLCYA